MKSVDGDYTWLFTSRIMRANIFSAVFHPQVSIPLFAHARDVTRGIVFRSIIEHRQIFVSIINKEILDFRQCGVCRTLHRRHDRLVFSQFVQLPHEDAGCMRQRPKYFFFSRLFSYLHRHHWPVLTSNVIIETPPLAQVSLSSLTSSSSSRLQRDDTDDRPLANVIKDC